MLNRFAFFLLLAATCPASAQDASLRYATMPDLATAQALSAAAWAAVRCTPQPACDPAQVTQFNYPIIGLTDLSRYAIVIHTGDIYQGEHLAITNAKVATVGSGIYTSGSGTVLLTTKAAHGLGVGVPFKLTGMTGTGSFSNLNATFVTTTGTTGTTLNFATSTGQTMTISGGMVLANKTFDLTANQIASLATRAGMGTQLPDILPIALVNSRVTAPELSAINTYANAHPTFKTNFTTLTSGPIDLEGTLVNTVFNELQGAGILIQTRIAVILAPQPASVVTQSQSLQRAP